VLRVLVARWAMFLILGSTSQVSERQKSPALIDGIAQRAMRHILVFSVDDLANAPEKPTTPI